ncbi:serine/threonine-protein phosphatase [bacterium]|nr:serine/threonine-protein phosphatase [bacterium]
MHTTQPLIFAASTDTGNIREQNEDRLLIPFDYSHLLNQRGYLFVVADGVGGHVGGERASQCCIDVLHKSVYGDAPIALEPAIQQANTAVYQMAQREAPNKGMGTTVVAALFATRCVLLAHVGDSRAYLVRNQYIRQVTNDHTLLAEKVQAGIISPEKAADFHGINPLTRAIGKEPDVVVELQELDVQPHDCIILCSDGLSNLVTADEISAVTGSHAPQQAVQHLIELAKVRGAPDNVTVVVVQVQGVPITPRKPRTWSSQTYRSTLSTSRIISIVFVAVVTLAAIGLFVFILMGKG